MYWPLELTRSERAGNRTFSIYSLTQTIEIKYNLDLIYIKLLYIPYIGTPSVLVYRSCVNL
jgi:hypothetical protein